MPIFQCPQEQSSSSTHPPTYAQAASPRNNTSPWARTKLYCLKKPLPTNDINKTIERINEDVRREYQFRNHQDDGSYIPKLYLKNPDWQPDPASEEIEEALVSFADRLSAEHQKHQQHKTLPNISRLQNNALRTLKDHPLFVVLMADKNMGVVLMLREIYNRRVFSEHLDNEQVYQRLTPAQAQAKQIQISYLFDSFRTRHADALEEPVCIFLGRCKRLYRNKIAKFYGTIKIHKSPWKVRPIVSKVGTYLEGGRMLSWMPLNLL